MTLWHGHTWKNSYHSLESKWDTVLTPPQSPYITEHYLLKKICHSEGRRPKAGQVASIIATGCPFQRPPTNKTRVPPLWPRTFAFCQRRGKKTVRFIKSKHEKQSIHVKSCTLLSWQVTVEGFTTGERSKKVFHLNLRPHLYSGQHRVSSIWWSNCMTTDAASQHKRTMHHYEGLT